MSAGPVRIGTRGSALAQAQAREVADALRSCGVAAETVHIETEGDRRAPDTPWGEGAFVAAIERALLDGTVDLAVHSAKDMPTAQDSRLRIVAFLARADPRDALVLRAGTAATDLSGLAAGTRVGTDSPRRTGFLRARRPDLDVRPLHGNVDTRLRRLDEGAVDALVLAAAGLERLGRADRISHRFAVAELPPAPGQGAIALQARSGDERLATIGSAVDDAATRTAVEAERAFLAATGGGCRAPVGALATVEGPALRLVGGFATVDGRSSAIEEEVGPLADAPALARHLAARLVARRAAAGGRGGVLVTRSGRQADRLVARLAEHGLSVAVVPAIEIHLRSDDQALRGAVARLAAFAWTVVTSANGAQAIVEVAGRDALVLSGARFAAVGSASGEPLRAAGVDEIWRPSNAKASAVGDELPIESGATILLVRGVLADDDLPARLRRRGAVVEEVVAYDTIEAPPASRILLDQAFAVQPPAVVVFASPSAVRGLLALAGRERQLAVLALPAVCIGPTTAGEARRHGFAVTEARAPDPTVVAETVAELVASQALEVDR